MIKNLLKKLKISDKVKQEKMEKVIEEKKEKLIEICDDINIKREICIEVPDSEKIDLIVPEIEEKSVWKEVINTENFLFKQKIENCIPDYENTWLPYDPLMADTYKRCQTFKSWPIQMAQSALDLSTAGFYYLKEGDKVRCFHCGVMIHKWEKDDDPVFEHKKHSEKCKFVEMVYGKLF